MGTSMTNQKTLKTENMILPEDSSLVEGGRCTVRSSSSGVPLPLFAVPA
jgi:hypothetical protein